MSEHEAFDAEKHMDNYAWSSFSDCRSMVQDAYERGLRDAKIKERKTFNEWGVQVGLEP